MSKIVSDVSTSMALLILVLGVVAAVVLPHIPFAGVLVWPLRMLATLVHEGSHGLMTLLTGGGIDSVVIRADGSGTLTSYGGIRVLILFAGYLGTSVFGFLLLISATNVKLVRVILDIYGVLFILLVVFYGRFDPLTVIAGVAAGVFLVNVANKAGTHIAMFISAFLGANIVMESVNDLLYLIVASSRGLAESDAGYMASEFMLPAVFWAVCWMAMSISFLMYGSYLFLSRLRGS